ncbi:hypothetical protein [Myxosarcina sp. GI1]|uniref:hypothetical protein n=1 Tax=Myxosarcina sp. GI1 TaxID=1541065 RepID=UPI00056916D6|nr:hypothetical protein [Myxosarcina sp. GI1]
MKNSIVKLISTISITALTLSTSLPALARAKESVRVERSVMPFVLVSQAQAGRLESQGIPGYGALKTQYMLDRVTAKSLVRAGIDAHLIPARTLQDRGYLNVVESQLRLREK